MDEYLRSNYKDLKLPDLYQRYFATSTRQRAERALKKAIEEASTSNEGDFSQWAKDLVACNYDVSTPNTFRSGMNMSFTINHCRSFQRTSVIFIGPQQNNL